MPEGEKTIAELTALANTGDRGAMRELGDRYYYGQGVRRDRVKSAEWYKRALGSIEASGYYRPEFSLKHSTARATRSAINYTGHAFIAAAATMTVVWVGFNIGFSFLLVMVILVYVIYYLLAPSKESRAKR